jgi:hypothetical protein
MWLHHPGQWIFLSPEKLCFSSCNNVLLGVRYTVEPRFTNLVHSWGPFITRNVRKPKLLWSHGVLFNNIFKKTRNTIKFEKARRIREGMCTKRKLHSNWRFPADTPSLSPAFVAGLRVHYSRHRSPPETFFVRKIFSWTNLFMMRGVHEPRFHCIKNFTQLKQCLNRDSYYNI